MHLFSFLKEEKQVFEIMMSVSFCVRACVSVCVFFLKFRKSRIRQFSRSLLLTLCKRMSLEPRTFQPNFLRNKSEAYKFTMLSVWLCVPPLITFEPVITL
jgi:hypothetical protein